MKVKIISDGQTGADLGGLRAAKTYGFPTGGCDANGFKTENGVYKESDTVFGLVDKGYGWVDQTRENVRESDLTLIYADDPESVGTKRTIASCQMYKKPFRMNMPAHSLCDLLNRMNKILPAGKEFVINVAGDRESVAPGIEARTERLVGVGLRMYKFIEKPPKIEEEEDLSW